MQNDKKWIDDYLSRLVSSLYWEAQKMKAVTGARFNYNI